MAVRLILLLGEIFHKFQKDRLIRAAASISYFILLTIVPLTLVAILAASAVLQGEDAQQTIVDAVEGIAGDQAAELVGRVVDSVGSAPASTNATIVSLLVALWAASLAFAHLRQTLDLMWESDEHGKGVRGYVVRRAIGIAFLFAMGAIVLVMTVAYRVVMQILEQVVLKQPLDGQSTVLFNDLIGFGILFLVFYAMYRILPHRRLPMLDLAIGALATTGLYVIGEWALGIYFSRASYSTLYGAAGTVMVLLLWLYYSTTVVLVGAEFTFVWFERKDLWADAGDLTLKEAVMRQLPGRSGPQSQP